MEALVDFKNQLSNFRLSNDMSKVSSLKVVDLKKLATDLYALLLCGDSTIDKLVKDRDDVGALRNSFDELRLQLSGSLQEKENDYASAVKSKKSVDPIKVSVFGKTKTVQDQQVIVVKPKSSEKLTNGEMNAAKEDIFQALGSIPVSNFKQMESGAFVVKLPSVQTKKAASNAITNAFPDGSNFVISEPRKMLPKLTLTGIPSNIKDEEIIPKILEKNSSIANLITAGCSMSLCFARIKQLDGRLSDTKTAVIKMSPEVRLAIINQGNYVFMDFSRCKAYDRFWVIQCFHCQKFGHLSADCSAKESAPICGFCAGAHIGRNCRNKNQPGCANCKAASTDNSSQGSSDHFASSDKCPHIIKQRQHIINNTNFVCSKN